MPTDIHYRNFVADKKCGSFAIVGRGASLSTLDSIDEDYVIALNDAAWKVKDIRKDSYRVFPDAHTTGTTHPEFMEDTARHSGLRRIMFQKSYIGYHADEPTVCCAIRLAKMAGATSLSLYCLDSLDGDMRTWFSDGDCREYSHPEDGGYKNFIPLLMKELESNPVEWSRK